MCNSPLIQAKLSKYNSGSFNASAGNPNTNAAFGAASTRLTSWPVPLRSIKHADAEIIRARLV